MGLPFIQELWDGIRWLIDFFFTKVPRVLQILIFIALLVIFGVIIPFFLHLVGVHCNYDGEIVTTSPLSMISNARIAFIDTDEIYNRSSYEPEVLGISITDNLNIGEQCRRNVCRDGTGDLFYASSDDCDNLTTFYIFKDESWDWAKCVECQGDSNYSVILADFGAGEADTFCFADALVIPESDRSWFQNWVCNPDQRCVPPENYYFESDTGTYDCIDSVSCGQNDTDVVPYVDNQLEELNAELFYTDDNELSGKRFVMFACTDRLQPQITVYGLPVFNYKFWVIILVIAALFIFLSKIKRH